MRYSGTVVRIQREHADLTLIIETGMGLRGVTLDRDEWASIAQEFELTSAREVIGWQVSYDPSSGDLDIFAPDDDLQAGMDSRKEDD